MPAGAVEHHHAMRPGATWRLISARCRPAAAIDMGQDEGGADGTLGADCTEQVGPGVAAVARRPGPGAAARPDPGQRALLADAGFILEPDLDRLAASVLGQRRPRQRGEAF